MGTRRDERTFPCHCCAFWTLTDPAPGSYEVCPVCFWEDDPVQNSHLSFQGGANNVCLNVARQNYIELGACEARFLEAIRPPTTKEVPSSFRSPDPKARLAITRGIKDAILHTSRSILSQTIDVVEGCSILAFLADGLKCEPCEDAFRTFLAVADQMDEMPHGEVRKLWDAKALIQKDAEASAYVARILPEVLDACRSLERHLAATQV